MINTVFLMIMKLDRDRRVTKFLGRWPDASRTQVGCSWTIMDVRKIWSFREFG
jgi:hypothetical protein